MSAARSPRSAAVGGLCLAVLALGGWAAGRDAPPARPGPWPSAAELDTLARYLDPAAPAPALDDYAAFLPAAPRPLPRPARVGEPVAEAPPMSWRLTAVLIAGDRPVAILNDQHVRPGDALEGGARVVSIARDHVVVREPNGARRTVWLADALEGS